LRPQQRLKLPNAILTPSSHIAVDAEMVSIMGIYYGGQDYEAALRFDLDD